MKHSATSVFVGALALFACSPAVDSSSASSGGAPATGGVTASGGTSVVTGGTATSTGGIATSTGGTVGTGGTSTVTGGSVTTGGSGGITGTTGGGSGNGGAGSGAGGALGGTSSGGAAPAGAGSGAGGASGGDSGGGGSGGGTAGGSSGPCSAAGLILCETFDELPLGQKPSDGPWLASQCADQSFTLEVDDAQSYSGGQSLLSRGIPYGACMLHASLDGATDFRVRARVRFAAGAADQFTAHEVVAFDLTPTTDTDDPGIRVGFRGDNSCQPTGAEVNITGGEEKTGCTGFQFVADTWYCLEIHVAPATMGVTTDFWIDGADQSYSIHGTPTTTVDNPDYAMANYLRLGTRSYSTQYMADIHVDDMAIGTQRIGCN